MGASTGERNVYHFCGAFRPNLFSGNLCFVVFVDVLMTKSFRCVNIFQISRGNLFDYERRLRNRFKQREVTKKKNTKLRQDI